MLLIFDFFFWDEHQSEDLSKTRELWGNSQGNTGTRPEIYLDALMSKRRNHEAAKPVLMTGSIWKIHFYLTKCSVKLSAWK